MPDVLLATAADRPNLWEDDQLLVDALADHGLSGQPAVWTDRSIDWSAARVVVLRSVFDYVADRDGFCTWADRVGALTSLHNPPRIIRWNSHKRYLRDLAASGIAIVPTEWIEAGSSVDLGAVLRARAWEDAVVKPAVGNGARGALRVRLRDTGPGQAHLNELLATRDVMIQPFIPATEQVGERALIFIDGAFSHAIRKDQMLVGREFSLDRTPSIDPAPEERALANRVLSLLPEAPLLYARVDVVVDDGVPRLMELEVIEPVLFFSKDPDAATRMADAIARRAWWRD